MTSDLRLAPNDVTWGVILALSSSSGGGGSSSDHVPTIDGADAGENSADIPEEQISEGIIPSTSLSHVISSECQKHGNDDKPTSPFAFRNTRVLEHPDTRSYNSDTRFPCEYSELTTTTTTLEQKIIGLRREAMLVDEIIRLSRRFLDERRKWIAWMTDETRHLRRRVLLRTVGGLHHQLTRQSHRLRQTLADISQSPS